MATNKLTAATCNAARLAEGENEKLIGDGNGLHLYVRPSGKSWLFVFTFEGKRRKMALGNFPAVGLADARERAADTRALIAKGIDPVALRDAPDEIIVVAQVMLEGFTRMPVYKHSLDNIIGVIYAKDVFSLIEHKNLIILHDILRPPFVVPGTKSVPDLLREFQRKRIHLAVVVDEFGGTEGIITLEDILEEIVGDIKDEYDEDARPFERISDDTVEVAGRMNIADFNELVNYHIPESEEYDTLGGFITKIMGRIPSAGDECDYEALRIDIVKVDERRIELVRITRTADET